MDTQYYVSIFHIHKHICVAIHEGNFPFPEAHKIHHLQALFLETLAQFLGHAAVLKVPSAITPVPEHDHRDAKGQQHLQANPTATPSSGQRTLGRRNHILLQSHLYLSCSERVFVFRLTTALPQGVNPCAQTGWLMADSCVSYLENSLYRGSWH